MLTFIQNNKKVKIMDKRYSKIDQHLAQHFKYNGECLSSPPPITYPFLNLMISTNQEKGLKF